MAQGTHENVFFFLLILTIYKEKVRKMNKKQIIRINETQLRQIVSESVKKMLNEETNVRFNWNITVSAKDASKIYNLKNKLENSKWVLDFECDEEPVEIQNLSINPIGKTHVNEESSFDMMKYEQMSEYRQTDPMNLSDSELQNAIEYMLAYRWALKGDEEVLRDYIEEAKHRGLRY